MKTHVHTNTFTARVNFKASTRRLSLEDESDILPSESPRWGRGTLLCQQMAGVCASYGAGRGAVGYTHAARDARRCSELVLCAGTYSSNLGYSAYCVSQRLLSDL